MKKLYTILLAASVAVSASADAFKAPVSEATSTNKIDVQIDRFSRNAKVLKSELTHKTVSSDAVLKAPAKAAATTMSELTGIYDYTFYLYSQQNGGAKKSVLSIEAGEGENEVKLVGLRYSDITVKGTVDFAAGTITLAPQLLLAMEEDPDYPGKSMDMWLYYGTDNGEDRTKSITIKLNADGTLSTDDIFVYGVEGLPGYSYALFDDLKMTKSTVYNTTVTLQERDTDSNGNFLNTYSEFNTFAFTELKENVMLGTESLGECVVISNFIWTTANYGSVITEEFPIYAQIERDTETAFIDTWYWFSYTLSSGSGRAAIIALDGQNISGIEATYAGNKLTWDGIWGSYDDGWFGYYKGCTLTLPFMLDDSQSNGISDVAVDNNENAPVEYYNLQGVRVSEPAAGQLVIRRQGNKTTKVLVK